MKKVAFEDFKKVDLRVGEITAVKTLEGSSKLYLLMVSLGKGEHDLQLVAGLREHYKEDKLIGKKVIVVRNLEHKIFEFGGEKIESQGMILAAVFKDKVTLIEPDKDIETGAKVE